MNKTGKDKVILEASAICKSFGNDKNRIEVLKGVDLEVNTGEMIAIVGASGSGKTTLLQVLGTLDTADSGTLLFSGNDLTSYSEAAVAEHRNKNIGFIFQFHHLLPEFNALENVMMPGLIAGSPTSTLRQKALDLLEQVDLEHRINHRSGELSGGEQQRVALARALVMEPALLFADEPTGNLDVASGKKVFSLLRQLSRTLSLSVIMVTHNIELAGSMDRCLTLADGSLG